MSADARIRRAERDTFAGRRLGAPNDYYWPNQAASGFDRAGFTGAWKVRTSSIEPVAVVDSGLDYNVLDFYPNIMVNHNEIPGSPFDHDHNGVPGDYWGACFVDPSDPDFPRYNPPTPGYGDPIDFNGHGTEVFSVLAARGNNGPGPDSCIAGAIWSGQVLPVKVLGRYPTLSAIIKGMEYAYQTRHVRLLNCSWTWEVDSPALREFLAFTSDALYVFGAGNDGADLDNFDPVNWPYHYYPQEYAYSNLLVVGGSDLRDYPYGDRLGAPPLNECCSNWGKDSVDLFALGEQPWAVSLGGVVGNPSSGTSFAAPLVTGVASLVWSEHPAWTPAQVKQAVLESVDPVPRLQERCVSGGRLNAKAALQR